MPAPTAGGTLSRSNELLLDAFGRVHESVPAVVAGLTEDQLSWYPGPSANSIAWLIWHLARVEDDHLAGVAAAITGAPVPQVWAQWVQRFGLPFPVDDTGYGQPVAQAHQVRCGQDLLVGYYDAVHARTAQIVAGLSDADLDQVVDRRWDPPVTAAVRLVSVVNDITAHIGQAAYIRGLIG
jgi:hypothetical protein